MNRLPRNPLPVLLPAAERLSREARAERASGGPWLQLRLAHGLVLGTAVLAGLAHAQIAGEAAESAWRVIARWMPLLLEGFAFNILISVLAMSIGTLVGLVLGLLQVSLAPGVRTGSWLLTQFFRNAPWLVLLFFCMFLLPFELDIGAVGQIVKQGSA